MNQIKTKTCKCGEKYIQYTSFQNKCVKCLAEVGRKSVQKDREKAQKAFRAETRRRKAELKPRSKWLSEAQKVFNKYIRIRDRHESCISCGRNHEEVESTDGWKPGGAWDCGHWLSRGAHPELRFDELNAHKQCKSCNGGSGRFTKKNSTVSKDYRERLIKKIGLDAVEWLEGPHEPKKYTIDDLKEIIKVYKQKIKELVKCTTLT